MMSATVPLLLHLMLTATPKVGLTIGSRVGVPEGEAITVRDDLKKALVVTGLEVEAADWSCGADHACLRDKGKAAGLGAVVSLTLARGPVSITVDIEVVSTQTGAQLAQYTWKWKRGAERALADGLQVLARNLAAPIVAHQNAVTQSDAPVKDSLVLVLTPLPKPELSANQPSRAPVVVTAVGAGAALIACAVFTGVAVANHGELPPVGSGRELIPLARAEQLRDAANGAYTGAAVAGGVAAGLAVTSLVLWLVTK